MPANNFLQFDEDASNLMSDVDYLADSQRQSGVVPGLASPALHNKLYYQATTMVAALAQFIQNAGFDAVDTNLTTLVTNLTSALTPTGETTGVMKDYWGASAPTGYVLADGQTIGSAASGATSRANSDTLNLYTLLWNATTNTELPIQDSSGAASSRGASAAVDFAANKRLPLPDMRGRVSIGLDNMGGTAANRITSASDNGANSTVMAGSGGAQTVALTADNNGPHSHTVNVEAANANNVNFGSNFTIFADNTNVTTSTSGSGTPHSNTQPWLACNKIIKL